MDKTLPDDTLARLEEWMTSLEADAAKIATASKDEAKAIVLKVAASLEALSEELQALVQKM